MLKKDGSLNFTCIGEFVAFVRLDRAYRSKRSYHTYRWIKQPFCMFCGKIEQFVEWIPGKCSMLQSRTVHGMDSRKVRILQSRAVREICSGKYRMLQIRTVGGIDSCRIEDATWGLFYNCNMRKISLMSLQSLQLYQFIIKKWLSKNLLLFWKPVQENIQ